MRHNLFVVLLLLSMQAYSQADNWTCKSHDAAHMEWSVSNAYQRMAINLAFDACKKQSKWPKTCKTSLNDCEGFLNGISTKPIWRCLALDAQAQPWQSYYYTTKDDAALAAKAYCKSKSAVPDTCFVNMVTCININQ